MISISCILAALSLNGVWNFSFRKGESIEQAFTPGFKAEDVMLVPGCFDTMPQWAMKKGTGLYRRSFTLETDHSDLLLVIDGAGLRAKFRIDGRDVGTDPLPWSRVELPVGALASGEHIIEAAVDNRIDFKNCPLFFANYDFYSFGGFYHGLTLVDRQPKVYVRTRDYRTGEVEVKVNGWKGVRQLVFDGTAVVEAEFENGRARVRVPDYKLWSPQAPSLHTVSINTPSGRLSVRFGIREIKAESGSLFLNGKPLFLKGFNRHESHPDQGAATTEDQMLRDLQLVKKSGANFIRGAHYPQAQRFLDFCDEMGLLVWEEPLGWGNYFENRSGIRNEMKNEEFRRLQLEQTILMVRNSFNHPSVILFGFLNECQSDHPGCRDFIGEMAAAIRAEDSGRLVTFAINRTPTGVEGREVDISAVHCDVISYNVYPGWIDLGGPGDEDHLRELVKNGMFGICATAARFRQMYPDKPIIVSEAGTCGIYGQRNSTAPQWTEEFQSEYVGDVIDAAFSCPDLCGLTLWQFADAASYHRGDGVRVKPMAMNLAGAFDGYRRPKLVADVIRRKFSEVKGK